MHPMHWASSSGVLKVVGITTVTSCGGNEGVAATGKGFTVKLAQMPTKRRVYLAARVRTRASTGSTTVNLEELLSAIIAMLEEEAMFSFGVRVFW